LTDQGRVAAAEALAQSQYLGPAPVSLTAFQEQVRKQAICNENLQEESFKQAFAGMNIPPNYVRKLLPAVRSGRTVLLYGPPGNGKTTIGTRVATMFRDVIYVPYAIEVGGQIIKMYDTGLHKPYADGGTVATLSSANSPLLETFDARWVACRRPVAMAGGELTVEMLDLGFDPVGKYYDAPLHMKALNGLFLIDDFGRQRVNPTDLLNRWIVPMESRIDYLKLNTGFSFVIPIDELVIFSTNLAPADLMDPAFLRRIPYKIECSGPSLDDYRSVFIALCNKHGLAISTDVVNYIARRLQSRNYDLAYFQPKFLCDQFSQLCQCFDLPPIVTREIADEGLENLYVDLRTEPDRTAAPHCPAFTVHA
jgi:predicted ATPase with chaperone activity